MLWEQHLKEGKFLEIDQKVECMEVLCGVEMSNTYRVYDTCKATLFMVRKLTSFVQDDFVVLIIHLCFNR